MDNLNSRELVKPTLSNKLTALFCTFIVMVIASGFIFNLLRDSGLSPRNAFLLGSVAQSVLAFIFPAWLVGFLCSAETHSYLGLSERVSSRQFVGAFIFMILFTPALNAIIEWNAGLTFPDALKGLEQSLRNMEDAAADTTSLILHDSSWWGLISGVLIVGCLTGFAEELLFRGGLQKALTSSGMNVHVAVWTSAFIFSAIHFQFFGFIPRMLLGAAFGYAFAYTGSIWISAFMHALNNSVVVITAWLADRNLMDLEVESLGTSAEGQIWFAVLSAVTCAFFIYYFGPSFFKAPKGKPHLTAEKEGNQSAEKE